MQRISPAIPTSGTKCAVCQTQLRPQYAPWHQHAVGCAVRAAALHPEFELRPAVPALSSIAAA
jgi:hypothetical protein